jgi:hypothetical protein
VAHHEHLVQAAAAQVGIVLVLHSYCLALLPLQLAQVAQQTAQPLLLMALILYLTLLHLPAAVMEVGAQLADLLPAELQQAVQAAAAISTEHLQARQEIHLQHLHLKATAAATVKALILIAVVAVVAPAQVVQQEQLALAAQVRRHQ